ncbi:16888_t:CDS:2, partial [Funneliformis mosseae]
MELQIPDNMRFVLNHNLDYEYFIHLTQNIFWKFRQKGIDEFDQRLAAIPRFPELKSFKYSLGSIKGSFILTTFDTFINTYKVTHHLASEAKIIFDMLINSLNQYFDFIEDITKDNVKTTLVKWYINAIIRETDIIRAKSNYYSSLTFSNITINMNEKETQNYNTFDSTCFAK